MTLNHDESKYVPNGHQFDSYKDDIKELKKIVRMQERDVEKLHTELNKTKVELDEKKVSYQILEKKYFKLKSK